MPSIEELSEVCPHTVTQGRAGETGSWCLACGEKSLAVDERECRDCLHFRPDENCKGRVGICDFHHMRVTADMHVTYHVAKGTCFAASAQS